MWRYVPPSVVCVSSEIPRLNPAVKGRFRSTTDKKNPEDGRPQGFFGWPDWGGQAGVWWSRGELNPRPQAINEKIYMFSCLI